MQLFKTERPVSSHSGKPVYVTPESQKAGAHLCCSALWLQDPVLEMSFSLWSWVHTHCTNGWISVKRWANCGLLMKLFWWDQKQGQPHCRPPHCVAGGTSPRTEGFPIPSWPWEMHIQRPKLEVRGESLGPLERRTPSLFWLHEIRSWGRRQLQGWRLPDPDRVLPSGCYFDKGTSAGPVRSTHPD